jgi:hypothetical protein
LKKTVRKPDDFMKLENPLEEKKQIQPTVITQETIDEFK